MKKKNKGSILAGLLALQFVMQAAGVQVTAFAEDAVTEPSAAAEEATVPFEAEADDVTVAEPTEAAAEPAEAAPETTAEAEAEPTEEEVTEASEAETEAPAEAEQAPEATAPTEADAPTLSTEAAPEAEAADSLVINNPGTIPSEIKEGTAVSISGTVVSANSKAITKVRVEILNKSGAVMYYGEAAPGTTSYDLKNLDSKLLFNRLAVGEYVYHVTATNAAGITTNQDVSFKVISANAKDTLTLEGTKTNIPATLKPGTPVTVCGTVKSGESNLTSVSIKLVDQNGVVYCPNKVVPGKTEYDLKGLDNIITFDKLPQGTYTFTVLASNKTHTDVVLQEQTFTVGTGASATGDALTLTGATAVPDTFAAGSDYAVTGTLTSASSNIKSLFVGIYNSAGAVVSGRTIALSTKTYDLKGMDDYVSFSGLGAGTYLFAVIASNDSKNNEVLLTKSFTVTGNTAVTSDELTLTNASVVPDTIKSGTTLSISGTVASDSTNLRTLTVAVYDLNGNFKTGGTINPAAKRYELSGLDRYVSFQTLAAGSYHYYVMASNDKYSNKVLAHKQFTVEGSTPVSDTMTISGFTSIPASITQNTVVNIKGTVTSGNSNLTTLFAGVYNSAGQVVTGRTINPASTSCDLAAKLNPYIEFNKLTAGDYMFAVIASNATTTNQVLVNQKFKITGTTSSTNSLKITGASTIPATIKQGEAVKVAGVVSSDSTMTSLFVGIYDSAGKVVSGRTVNPNATSFDISQLDAYVKFNELQAGNYIYAVIATNATNTNYPIVKQNFTVGSTTSTDPSADKMTLTGASTVPDNIPVGKALSVYGTVTSATSNITQLTVGVYKGSQFVTGRSIAPNAKTYNLANLDRYVEFDKLTDGEYTYAVIASNAAYTNETLLAKKFTVGKGDSGTTQTDTITISGGTTVPSTLNRGTAVSVKGTITASANLTSVTVAICDANGNPVYTKTVTPNAKTYTISSEIDNAMYFNRLAAGSYSYRVIASTAATSNYTVVNQAFTVK